MAAKFLTAAAHHLPVEDVPGVVETVVGAEEPTGKVISSTTDLHLGRTPVLDDEGIEEPPCLGLGPLRVAEALDVVAGSR
jgi:hypothetical protein